MADPLDPLPALEVLNRLLAEKPDQVTEDFSLATRRLAAYHDALIHRLRAGDAGPDAQRQLGRLNGVITAVYACHYPLRRTQWDTLQQARDAFVDVASIVSGLGLRRDQPSR